MKPRPFQEGVVVAKLRRDERDNLYEPETDKYQLWLQGFVAVADISEAPEADTSEKSGG